MATKVRGLYRRGSVWWITYNINGRRVRESTDTPSKTEAMRILAVRRGDAAKGMPMLRRPDRVRYDEAAADLREHYKTTKERRLDESETRLAHLDRFFRGYLLTAIQPHAITRYVAARQAEPTRMIAAREGETITRRLTSNASINRELAVLGRMLKLAYENGKLVRMPVIRKLKEAAPRAGFFEEEAYEAVRRQLPVDLQVVVDIGYRYGWRIRSEVLTLKRQQVDLRAGTLRLEMGETKNDDGREVPLTEELRAALAAQLERVKALERRLAKATTGPVVQLAGIPWVFPHLTGRRAGQQRHEMRKAWATACRKAGVPGMLKHDLRRTAVRGMVRAGIPERVAMKVTGHKTRSVFDRYHIVSPADLREAIRKLDGHNSGTIRSAALETISLKG